MTDGQAGMTDRQESTAGRVATMAAEPDPSTRVRVRTRWDDCDRNGHVNNAAYAALVRAAHDRAGLPAGRLRALTIAYREPIGAQVMLDVDVDVGVDVAETAPSALRVAYALRHAGRPAAEAEAVWQLADPPLHVDLPPIARDAGGHPFRFGQAVRTYDVGTDGDARPQAILQWLEHAVFRAAARAGWPSGRMLGTGFLSLVVEHRLVLGEPAREADELAIESRLVELRRVSGVWHHEVRRRDGALVAADRARGAFLDLAGRIRPAPPELLEDLLRGEPDG